MYNSYPCVSKLQRVACTCIRKEFTVDAHTRMRTGGDAVKARAGPEGHQALPTVFTFIVNPRTHLPIIFHSTTQQPSQRQRDEITTTRGSANLETI